MTTPPSNPVPDTAGGAGVGVRFDRDGAIAVVTLDRPERGNALTGAMHAEIVETWREVRENDAIRVAIVTGAGDRHFCTGADVGDVAAAGGVTSGDGPLTEAVRWSPRQNQVWKPVICAVNGVASGAGLHFVVDSDIVVAADTAAFMDTHVNVGMVGAIENIGLAKRLPLGSALRITLMGRDYRMPAARAYQLGLVDELVARAELLSTAMEMAAVMARNSPVAMALSQQAIWGSLETGLTPAIQHGWALIRMHWGHPDFTEGPRAFADRRPPVWTVGGSR